MIVSQSMLSDQHAQLGSIEGSFYGVTTGSQGIEAGSVGMTAQWQQHSVAGITSY